MFTSMFGPLAVLSLFASTGAATAFTPTAKNNVAIYWGQGPYQQRLIETCKNSNIDIINVAFINVFPDQGAGGYPGSNFGNACEAGVYTVNGVQTQLLKNCSHIGPDIKTCQKTYGKKILLSLGGGYPINQYIVNDTSAVNFATFLWGAFGPQTTAWTKARKPRPFGSAAVDGFDFDIESEIDPPPTYDGKELTDYKTRGYGKMISTFRNTLFKKDTSKNYYISAAPQCIVPDSHFGTLVTKYWFDFMFVQFYNTPQCSARAGIQHIQGGKNDISFAQWSKINFYNKNLRVYIGLPANTNASGLATYYLPPYQVQKLVNRFYSNAKFGGIMLWEATYAMNNVICGDNYATWAKKILNAKKSGQKLIVPSSNSTCPAKRDAGGQSDPDPALPGLKRQALESPSAPVPSPSPALVDPVVPAVGIQTSTLAPAPAPASTPSPAATSSPSIVPVVPSSVAGGVDPVNTPAIVSPSPTPIGAPQPIIPTSSVPVPAVVAASSGAVASPPSPIIAAAANITTVSAGDAATTTGSTVSDTTVADATADDSSIYAAQGVQNATLAPANATEAPAQATRDTQSLQPTGGANTTSVAYARVQNSTFANTTSVVNATVAAATADGVDVTVMPTTAGAADGPVTTPAEAAKVVNGPAQAEATRFVTETITNIVYETMSTCVPTVSDCAAHPESQTVVVVTSTVDVRTTVYITVQPEPSARTMYSNIYNTISVYYAPTAGAGVVDAKLFNPHAELDKDDSTTTTTVQSTTTVYETMTILASRTTTTMTSTVTVWPTESDAVTPTPPPPAANKMKVAVEKDAAAPTDAAAKAQTATNKAVSADAQVASPPPTPIPTPTPAAEPPAYTQAAVAAPFAVPGNSSKVTQAANVQLEGAVRGNTNATGFRAAGLDPAKAFALQAKQAGDASAGGGTNGGGRIGMDSPVLGLFFGLMLWSVLTWC